MRPLFAMLVLLTWAAPAAATVTAVDPGGFTVSGSLHVAAPADKAYAVLVRPSLWWNGEHTYSGNAANLTMEARAGGCWCEALPGGGSVQHMAVVYVDPGKVLRLRALDGVMTFSLMSANGGTDITMRYVVGGYAPSGFKDLAPGVDEVLMEQLAGLKAAIEAP
jgi:Polyketide cyclase / dehydrase and lipid transport